MWRLVFLSLVGCGRLSFAPLSATVDSDGGTGPDSETLGPADATGPLGCNLVELAHGAGHTCARTADNAVHCWGQNNRGQLGDGTMSPRLVPGGPSVGTFTALARAEEHTQCAIAADSTLWCWGGSDNAQLGTMGTFTTPRQIQRPLNAFDRVVKVQAGEHSVCARRDDDTVWCWGWNMYGQGGGTLGGADISQPNQILVGATPLLADELVAGWGHNCVLRAGVVNCWGYNLWGQLGDGTTDSRAEPAELLSAGVAASDIVALSAGYLHSCAIRHAGGAREVHCWGTGRPVGNLAVSGSTSNGLVPAQLPGGATIAGAASIAVGDRHSCAVLADTSVLCWGDNDGGQLGDGTLIDRVTAAPVLLVGDVPLTGVLRLSVSNSTTCALRATDVVCWGINASGQLGTGGTSNAQTRATPILCP